ncbi:hypothetical protein DXX93_06645 [Thalassotalea euphylliae]|uniref:Uncharacterized protein n=1 Tax=Thalassotalea euphylliae TaxID=1655234 RepID=A0A3E0TQH2_9GAMM|nr:hypothetical protein [Thalassotalea euphylliae]REL26292.1 hypothetical protein DXX93_06645 [Thalassotalea euphylliae]
MKMLKIEVFENNVKDTTIKIPLDVLKAISRVFPKKYLSLLEAKSMGIEDLILAATNPDTSGTIVEIEDHQDNERVIISVE